MTDDEIQAVLWKHQGPMRLRAHHVSAPVERVAGAGANVGEVERWVTVNGGRRVAYEPPPSTGLRAGRFVAPARPPEPEIFEVPIAAFDPALISPDAERPQ